MNILELYRKNPGNYILHSESASQKSEQFSGGAGKTTQLRYMAAQIAGENIDGRIVIPIFIKMAELNLKQVEPGVIYSYILKYFNNCVTEKAVDEMIQKSAEYDFLFILDGLNEVNDYAIHGQTVYTYIKNDIRRLAENENVHVIISMRKEFNLFAGEELGDSFVSMRLCALNTEQILTYLEEKTMGNMSEPLKKIVSNPMLLKMFKVVYDKNPELALSLNSRYELMDSFFLLDTEFMKDIRWSDNLIDIRKYVIEEILPRLVFRFVCALMNLRENELEDLDFEEELDEILDQCDIPLNMDKRTIRKVIDMMSMVDQNFIFQHDLIRDFLAVKGLDKVSRQAGGRRKVQCFFKYMAQNLTFIRRFGKDFVRRTRYLDLAEFVYAEKKENLWDFLRKDCGVEEEEALYQAELFYYNLASLYEDLKDKVTSLETGMIAIRHLEKLEERDRMNAYEIADQYNCLYYCVNTIKERNPLIYLESAEKWIGEIPEGKVTLESRRLKGRIISNYGSYYYNRKEYEAALEFHKKALEYRQEQGLLEDVVESYRTIMSDYYWMGRYYEGYQIYQEAKTLFNEKMAKKLPVDFAERAMGSEIPLLQDKKSEPELKVEIAENLAEQIEYIYEESVVAARKDVLMLRSLCEKKLEPLMAWLENDATEYEKLSATVKEYVEKCKALLG